MFVVPFFYRTPVESLIPWSLQPVVLFLDNRGKQVCQVDTPQEWLRENGFVVKQCWQTNTTLFAEVDTQLTQLSDFYSFEQLTLKQQKGTEECWRTFFLMKSEEDPQSSSIWNKHVEAPFLGFIEEIKEKCKL